MKSFFRSLRWPLVAFVIYLVMQVVCSVAAACLKIVNHDIRTGTIVALGLLLSSVVTSIVLLRMKKFELKDAFRSFGCTRQMTLVAFVAVLAGLFGSNLINEFLDLPNPFEKLFTEMSGSIWGMLAIGVLGPICEEIVFRGGIMKPMLKRGINPWAAILTSAVIFGLIHGNPAQIFFATLVGIMFGIVYYRTGSLVITTICHVVNNSMAVVVMNLLDEESKNQTTADMIGTPGAYALLAVFVTLCVMLLRNFWQKTEATKFVWQEPQEVQPELMAEAQQPTEQTAAES